MELDEILNNMAFWILSAVGIGAFTIMIIILNKMGQSEIMPLWVKIFTYLIIPVAAALFSGYASGN